uniref:hypothetical protein n=1 Tax=Aeromonas sp. Ne-1 TaxID=1675689 RepID=UPI00156653D9|nr:hypothetical protein [Aeromonas sp. Ne-1]
MTTTTTKPLLNNMTNIISAFLCEGNISLDKEYLEQLADGKFTVQPIYCLMKNESIKELIRVNNNSFDFLTYHGYLENCQDDEADTYFRNNAKCISVESHNVKIATNMNELVELYKEERELERGLEK